jgi:hypothetical protein
MAVYKIFPEKSATIYSYYPALNAGVDEILDLSTYKSITGTDEVSRPLIKFPTDQIKDVIDNKISGSQYDAYLKLYLAQASEVPANYTLFCYTLTQDWNVGSGRLGNSPITTDGVSWVYTDQSGSNIWTDTTFQSAQTGSYSPDGAVGGGTWWDYPNLQFSQSFSNISTKDIEIKVTNTVDTWYDDIGYENYGFILKHSSSLEFTDAPKLEIKYFSGNTHTIYPPALEFRWNDSLYNTGSLSVVTSSLFALTLGNNKGEFQQDSVQRFRVNVRDIYPSVAFRTSISYANTKALPSSSYWSIKDLDTEEIVVDYDTSYTKISCDSNGNYFDIYMNGLEPERYYKLLVKTVVANQEVVISDKDYIFKVIR